MIPGWVSLLSFLADSKSTVLSFLPYAIFAVLSLNSLAAVEAAQKKDINGTLLVQDRKRLYRLHLPGHVGESKKMPLVIVLHGGMENGVAIAKITGMSQKSDREGFIVAYPYGSGRLKRKFLMWNSIDCCGYAVQKNIDDVAFISALIEKLEHDYPVDKQRIFVCGYSNGAMLALRLGGELCDKLAAIGSIGGSMSGKEKSPGLPVSILMIHGTDDRHVPYKGGLGKWAKWGYPVNKESVAYALDFWKKADACLEKPLVSEDSDLKIETYSGGRGGSEVKLITMKGARHTWPGGKQSILYTDRAFDKISATEECWKFFSEHPKAEMLGSDPAYSSVPQSGL